MRRFVLVTGANRGIGRATTEELARRGARVLMVCRNRERGEEALETIAREADARRLELLRCDLSVMSEVHDLVSRVEAGYPRLDVLVNNAGVYSDERRTTPDGLELQFAVNHMAPFLLTNLLRTTLESSAPSRVVIVSSDAHRRARLDFDDLQLETGYTGWKAYCRSKLANVLFTRELARRWEGTGVTANCLHPGTVSTRLLEEAFGLARFARPLLKSPEEGARTPVYLAVSPEVEGVTGKYFRDCEPVEPSPAARDSGAARRLWEVSARLAGLTGRDR